MAWLGLNDFYFMNGKEAESIGGPIRKKFFELVSDDELESVYGVSNPRFHEVLWVANTADGTIHIRIQLAGQDMGAIPVQQ